MTTSDEGTGTGSKLIYEQLTEKIIGAAIEVHKTIGPGLLENIYEECLCHELGLRRVAFKRQIAVPLIYKGKNLNCSFRLDMVVEDLVLLELKSVSAILPVHEAQLLTYMRLLNKRVGFIINFNVPVLKNGIVRKIL